MRQYYTIVKKNNAYSSFISTVQMIKNVMHRELPYFRTTPQEMKYCYIYLFTINMIYNSTNQGCTDNICMIL